MPSWKDTRLWQQLAASSSPERPNIEGLLQQWMPDIETVLNAGTAPLDFTLHDKEHSFRVAEWMAKIVPEDVLPKLSAYELALLLLSAYLHDIGMTPEQARVQRHWQHLVFGPAPDEKDRLSPEEAAEFQRWLDDERGGLVPPLAQDGRPSEDDLRLAAELITYYARHKHNDWSGEWIRENATGVLGSYKDWGKDLVRLCQSHHEVYADLVKEAFDPRPAGRHGEVVHLRYLACVLRVADILDVDPERTPPVLFQHRDIAPRSVIYWWKDHDFWVNRDGSTLVVHALPRSAVAEKAVRDTAEWIRIELETCARLDREKPFSHSSFRASEPLPHKWSFPESLLLQVRPRDDDYVYIDGAFRPNTAKLLELLSGAQLYKEPLAAVRELLQNAFDAVKEQVALERLEGDPTDAKRIEAITALQNVELRFEERAGRAWLLCTDSGVGMTRSIIEKYLLVSGSSRRHDILELERRCVAAGFRLGRTGQFGIGVLSYFMLADRVEIRTRRSAEHGDAETHGWEFQTEGVGSFGELRKDFEVRPGTMVSLRLRRDVVANREEFLSGLQEYLLDTLLRVPCSLQLLVEGETGPRLRIKAGWQTLTSRLVDDYIHSFEADYSEDPSLFPEDRIPKSHLERRDLALKEWSGVAERFQSAIQWKTEAGQLPGGIGHYRLSVPFFHLLRGRSVLFFDFDHDPDIPRRLPFSEGIALALQPEVLTSFQGMRVWSDLDDETRALNHQIKQLCLAEIDWEDPKAGQITVDRSTFSLTNEASEAISWLKSRGEKLQAGVLSEELSDYAELNALLNPLVSPPLEAQWLVKSLNHTGFRWGAISFPVLNGNSHYTLRNAVEARGNSRFLPITHNLRISLTYTRHEDLEWCTSKQTRAYPNRPVVIQTFPLAIVPQYIALPQRLRHDFFEGEFPPAWSTLAALGNDRRGEQWLWNRDHPLVQTVESQDLEWFAGFKLWQLSEDLLQSRGRSVLFLMKALQTLNPERYLELAEDFRAGFLSDLWDRAAVVPAEIVVWVERLYSNSGLWVLGPKGIERILSTDPRITQYLPDPGDEWKLTPTYRDDSAGT